MSYIQDLVCCNTIHAFDASPAPSHYTDDAPIQRLALQEWETDRHKTQIHSIIVPGISFTMFQLQVPYMSHETISGQLLQQRRSRPALSGSMLDHPCPVREHRCLG